MTGLFTGVIGNLIGAGIQATVGGIPIREDASKALDLLRLRGVPVPPANWFSEECSNERRTVETFGGIGQHFAGAMQVLGPCMQIAKVLGHVVHPSSQPTTTGRIENPLAGCKVTSDSGKSSYRGLLSPVKTSNSIKTTCDRSCATGCKVPSSMKSVDSPKMKNPRPMKNSYENPNSKKTEQAGNHSASNRFTRLQEKRHVIKTEAGSSVLSSGRNLKTEKLINCAGISKDSNRPAFKGDKKPSKFRDKSGKSINIKKCQICQSQIRMPCGHMFCSNCLKDQKLFECPECGSKFN